jgi:hypothetical protein
MKSCIVKTLLAWIAISLSGALFASPDISGSWKCSGHDPFKKKEMTSSGEIKKTGDTYSLTNWKEDGANDLRSGTGLASKKNNSLGVMFWSNDNPEYVGFGVYEIKSKDKIVGAWTMKNGEVSAEETCERVKA